MKAKLVVATVGIILFVGVLPCFAQTNWEVVKTFQVGGQGWDYFTIRNVDTIVYLL